IGADGPRDWTSRLVDERGLVDPDKVANVIFESAHRAFDAFEERSTHSVGFENVEIVLPDTAHVRSILIHSAELTRIGDELTLAGRVSLDGRDMVVEGRVHHEAEARRIEAF